jgi:hypothetical protein
MALELPDFWTIAGIALALLALVAAMISVPSANRVEFWVSRICAIAAAVLFLIKIALWGTEALTAIRLVFVAFFGAAVTLSLTFALHWISKKEEHLSKSAPENAKPTLFLECIHSALPAAAPPDGVVNIFSPMQQRSEKNNPDVKIWRPRGEMGLERYLFQLHEQDSAVQNNSLRRRSDF